VFTFRQSDSPTRARRARTQLRALDLDPARPCVLLFGGKGARERPTTRWGALERGLLPGQRVVGNRTASEAALAHHADPGRVVVRDFRSDDLCLSAADLVVCRAGAMTVAELCAWGKASVLVPLPTAAADHQTYNARALADVGAAVLLPEGELSPESLADVVSQVLADRVRLASLGALARDRGHPGAAREIAARILTLSP
jgi:UDP-N-acetylglucosamine--N-acetylmuramyl-(pentapeptide) pyrophosphoryl-undecaprenol N-acetylglucosamine transferase